MAAQVAGAITAAFVLYGVASGHPDFSLTANGLAVNGFGRLSPGGYAMSSALVAEFVLTLGFLS